MQMEFLEPMLEDQELIQFIDEVVVLASLMDYEIKCSNWEYLNQTNEYIKAFNENGKTWKIVFKNNKTQITFVINYVYDKIKRMSLILDNTIVPHYVLDSDKMKELQHKLKESL